MTDDVRREPEDWKTGDEPMTSAQASYLRTLADEGGIARRVFNELEKAPERAWWSSSAACPPR